MNLKELRKKKNLSQSQVAEALGISLRAYQNYEYNQREPNIEMINKLADYFNVTVDKLLERNTKEQDAIDELAAEFDMSAFEKKIVDNYLSLPKSMRGNLMEFLRKTVKEVQDESGE